MTQSHPPSNARQIAPSPKKKKEKNKGKDEREAAVWMKEDGGRDAAVLGRGVSVSRSFFLSFFLVFFSSLPLDTACLFSASAASASVVRWNKTRVFVIAIPGERRSAR